MRFSARLDGYPRDPSREAAPSVAADLIGTFRGSIPRVLKRVERGFPGGAALYGLRSWLNCWLDFSAILPTSTGPGHLVEALESFACRDLRAPRAGTGADRRLKEFWRANAEPLLYARTVSALLPAAWGPGERLRRQAVEAARRILPAFEHRCELELRVRRAGEPWRRRFCGFQRRFLVKRLDEGSPCPIILLRDSLSFFLHPVVLVTNYSDQGDHLRLDAYDVARPSQPLRLCLHEDGRVFGDVEAQGLLVCRSLERQTPRGRLEKHLDRVHLLSLVWTAHRLTGRRAWATILLFATALGALIRLLF